MAGVNVAGDTKKNSRTEMKAGVGARSLETEKNRNIRVSGSRVTGLSARV